jgi:hypothetical protein
VKFREIILYLDWDNRPLKAVFYNRLKDKVKDYLFELNKPEFLSEYIAVVIYINN